MQKRKDKFLSVTAIIPLIVAMPPLDEYASSPKILKFFQI